MALIGAIGNFAGFVSPYVTGALHDLTGGYEIPMFVVGAMMLVAAFTLFVLNCNGLSHDFAENQLRFDEKHSLSRDDPENSVRDYVAPSTGRAIRAVLFDTFGSVVDWRSGIAREVSAFAAQHGIGLDAFAFADAWRSQYEPSMEPVRSGTRGFVPLDQLHRENLLKTMEQFGVDPTGFGNAEITTLNSAWERLDPWPDSVEGLRLLGEQVIVGPLSNANLALLLHMARHARLPWTVIIGSDATRAYKPDRRAYQATAEMLRFQPGEVMLAAAHNGDLSAARKAGLATAFFARPTEHGPGQRKNLRAEDEWDIVCDDIIDLARHIAGPGPSAGAHL